MGFTCGIVGLPNVGKSTLFNALTASASAEAANYPFCTIEPNQGRVPVPDDRLRQVAELAGSARTIPTFLEFLDIAGLVRGASTGEGLGNQFLGQIRQVDAVVHVLRCFEDADIAHVEDRIDAVADAETVETELLLADLESLEGRVPLVEKRARGGDKEAKERLAVMQPALELLRAGRPAREMTLAPNDRPIFKSLHLLTAKPVLYVCNVDEATALSGNGHVALLREKAEAAGAQVVLISAALEADVAALDDPAERAEFLAEAGLAETGLNQVVRAGYRLLDLITFFTAGPKEARAETLKQGSTAPQAAGQVHSDMERGFIRAETISFEDYLSYGGEHGARDAGRMRSEGRDYVVADGDVFLFRFNV